MQDRTIWKSVLCVLIAVIFLMPLSGVTRGYQRSVFEGAAVTNTGARWYPQ